MTDYRNKEFKVINAIAEKAVDAVRVDKQRVGVLATEPVLKPTPGPGSTTPLAEGDDPATHPGAVLQWFVDVRLDGDQLYLRDCIITTQARRLIGTKSDPVVVLRDQSTGAWQVVGRADRVTETQVVQSFTVKELEVQFVRGLRISGTGDLASSFFQFTQSQNALVTQTKDGKSEAGLNRGIDGFDTAGNPITDYTLGVATETLGFDELTWGTTPFGALREIVNLANGSSTETIIAP